MWQKAIELAVETYHVTRFLPKEEQYGLTSQMRRAAVSIPANIAEGHAREGILDYIRFVGLSRGSASELDTYLEIVSRLEYLTPAQLEASWCGVDDVRYMLIALQKSLRRRSDEESTRR